MNFKQCLAVLTASATMAFTTFAHAEKTSQEASAPSVLVQTQQALVKMMGISPLMIQSPKEAITLPIYGESEMVLNKTLGMDFDDGRRSLPFATFVSDSHYDDVVTYYKKALPDFAELHQKGETQFVKLALDGGRYPNDYYQIPNIEIFPTQLVDGSDGTMFVIMYHEKKPAKPVKQAAQPVKQ